MFELLDKINDCFLVLDSKTNGIEQVSKEKLVHALKLGIKIVGASLSDSDLVLSTLSSKIIKKLMLSDIIVFDNFIIKKIGNRVRLKILNSGDYYIPHFINDIEVSTTVKEIKLIGGTSVTTCEGLFSGCNDLRRVDLSCLDTQKVTSMRNMFRRCFNLEELNLENLDTSSVHDMRCMFGQCVKLKSLNLSSFNTSNVISMESMFSDCVRLENVILSSFDTSNVEDMEDMFYNCERLRELDLSNFNTKSLESVRGMFYGCNAKVRVCKGSKIRP